MNFWLGSYSEALNVFEAFSRAVIWSAGMVSRYQTMV